MISRRQILSITALTSLAVRLIFGVFVWGSPYRFYHVITSLDMATHLRFSDGVSFPPLFVAHRFLLQILRIVCGGHTPFAIFAVQTLCGIAGAVLTAELALRLWRDRAAALFAGLLAALYGVYLVYEFAVLQEALLVNLTLGALVFLLIARAKRYQWEWSFLAALTAVLALAGRPAAVFLGIAAVIWTIGDCRTSKKWRFIALLFLGVAFAACFNHRFSGSWNPFFRIDYVVSVNRTEGAGGSSWSTVLLNVAGKIPLLFSAHEIPENLNYYYLCGKLPFLALLPRPEGVIPLGIAGFLTLIAFSRFRGRALLPGIVIFLLLAPLAARYPVGRYRLMLIPYFIVYASCLVAAFRQLFRIWWQAVLLGMLILGVFTASFFLSPPRVVLRSSDDYAWAIACEAAGKRLEAKEHYLFAWRNGAKRGAAQRLFQLFMEEGKYAESLALTQEMLQRYPDDDLFAFDQAAVLAALHRDAAAQRLLEAIVKQGTDPEVRQNAVRFLQELKK
ncbi:MAG: glycosyltransferase family 39 protein [Victivallaceae bacterium]|nr:glycosyltransferase family 39 protein [Victivallaceae bacterium]